MSNKFNEIVTRINDSILRLPDRLSTTHGEATRAEFSRIFGQCIIGHEHKEGGLYLTLPFQTSLLTDPILYIVPGGLIVLDHPIKNRQFEFAIDAQAHVVDLSRKDSLYEDRYPRLIAVARKHEKINVSLILNRLMQLNFRGPFAKGII
jgi:hypothetical protein